MPEPKYDVAISFLSGDEKIASAISDQLSTGMKVFFFPRRQEELAGTNGLETMRAPFLEESRVVVVLYREPWGKTEWTRVEETAITDRCLKTGWQSLFFVVLDTAAALPAWLPHTHVWFNYTDYGVDQAVGAIKARVQEHGGIVRREDALARARIVQEEADHLATKEQRFRDMRWIIDDVHPAVAGILVKMAQLSNKVSEETGLRCKAAADKTKCVITSGRVSLHASWSQQFANQLESARLIVTEFNGQIAMPGERLMYLGGEPDKLQQWKFRADLSRAYDLCWVEEQNPGASYSHEEVADKCVRLFLDLVARQQRNELPKPRDWWGR